MRALFSISLLFFSFIIFSQNDCSYLPETFTEEVECEVIWKDWNLDICNSSREKMLAYDIDNDDIDELIIGYAWYWQILKYNTAKDTFEFFYQSEYYENLRMVQMVDLMDDGVMDLIISGDDDVEIYRLDGELNLTHTINLGWLLSPFNVRYSNITPNGKKYLVFAGRENLFVYDLELEEIKTNVTLETGIFDIGNIDSDNRIEVVFGHGDMYEFDENEELIFQKDLFPGPPDYREKIEFENVDGDPWEELIIGGFNEIIAFNADTETNHYSITVSLNQAESMELYDHNGDGTRDIIYGNDQTTNIFIHDGLNAQMLWSIKNPHSGTHALAYGNFDSDSNQEVFFTAGCSSSGEDHLHLADIQSNLIQWTSGDIDGPNLTLEVADLDQDGVNEIITWSYSSNSFSAESVMSIYNEETKELKYRSRTDYPSSPGSPYRAVADVHIYDYGNDGDLDVVFYSKGILYVFDGTENNIEYQTDLGLTNIFSAAIEVADLDNDGTEEIILFGRDKMAFINPNNLTVKEVISLPYRSDRVQKYRIVNIDNDSALEIVTLDDHIFIIDDYNNGYRAYESTDRSIADFETMDWTGDGKIEIVGSKKQGGVFVFSGKDFNKIETIYLQSGGDVTATHCHDLNKDGTKELIVIKNNALFFLSTAANIVSGQSLGLNMGSPHSVQFVETDDSAFPNLLIGTNGLIEVSSACVECLWFDPQITCYNPTCGDDNGKIYGFDLDTTTTYYIPELDQTFKDSITGLSPSRPYYNIIATNQLGCVREFRLELEQEELTVYDFPYPANECVENSGSIEFWASGLDPITLEWINVDSGRSGTRTLPYRERDTLRSLGLGTYALEITDANNCVQIDTVDIELSEILIDAFVTQGPCEGEANGVAQLISTGSLIDEIYWDGVLGGPIIETLDEGTHTVEVFDIYGCTKSIDFQVDLSFMDFQLIQLNSDCSGSATTGNVLLIPNLEVRLPYLLDWSHEPEFMELLYYNLPLGNYSVTITDGCDNTVIHSVDLEANEFNATFESQNSDCSGFDNGTASVTVETGTPPYYYEWSNGESFLGTNSNTSSISNLSPGNYNLVVTDEKICSENFSFTISEPTPIIADATIGLDNMSTPTGEGDIMLSMTGGAFPYAYRWDFGAETGSVSGLVSGDYNVTITDANGCQLDTFFTVNFMTALNELSFENFRLYPNPTSNKIFIDYPANYEEMQFQLFSVNGLEVSKDKFVIGQENDLTFMDLNNLSAGIYFVRMSIHEKQTYKKIVLIN